MNFLNKIIPVVFLLVISLSSKSQVDALTPGDGPFPTGNADMVNWDRTGKIDNGIQIKTNMPLHAGYRPVIRIEGYNYTTASTIGLTIAWDNSDADFKNATASSTGGFTPKIYLKYDAREKVSIFLNVRGDVELRFTVSTRLQGFSADEHDWFSEWSTDDNFQEGTEVIYANSFNGDLQVNGLLTAREASIPKANIGELTLDHVNGVLVVRGHQTGGDIDPIPVGGVTLYGDDGGIDIISGNDNHSYIDFRGLAHLEAPQGRIQHSDNEGFKIYTAGINGNPKMVINNNGVVGIGNTTALAFSTDVYKLYVEGGIRTRKLKVDNANIGWPDYVFEPTYQLRSLQNLETYLKQYKHLPDLPAAGDVEKEGVDVGEVQALLLKKVEELTLYVIQLNKTVVSQQKLIEKQQQALSEIQNKQLSH